MAQRAVRAGVSVLVGPSRQELIDLLATADVVLDCMLGFQLPRQEFVLRLISGLSASISHSARVLFPSTFPVKLCRRAR